jgi:hypothetical protein
MRPRLKAAARPAASCQRVGRHRPGACHARRWGGEPRRGPREGAGLTASYPHATPAEAGTVLKAGRNSAEAVGGWPTT